MRQRSQETFQKAMRWIRWFAIPYQLCPCRRRASVRTRMIATRSIREQHALFYQLNGCRERRQARGRDLIATNKRGAVCAPGVGGSLLRIDGHVGCSVCTSCGTVAVHISLAGEERHASVYMGAHLSETALYNDTRGIRNSGVDNASRWTRAAHVASRSTCPSHRLDCSAAWYPKPESCDDRQLRETRACRCAEVCRSSSACPRGKRIVCVCVCGSVSPARRQRSGMNFRHTKC